ncbi:endo alpha-1,4 polygalactosaminidase [Cohnella thailandensis]|uniref:Endo alpha-1,4 polygalactosaminidase n=1 Tax=Cohnella thailandensis TaxID=557557 RepID=A0A841T2P5_9BACL|nr:endo alpha-1,4 polygalactosaminidase [Cohnella thailandensis]MBB6637126.1 endo alpha-1,4 polygalactosaminidase [Cohnella thailandensis]MBP1977056.1 hypothetical protein [Cohnella thailandensis]
MKSIRLMLLIAVLFISIAPFGASASTVSVDGDAVDWNGIPELYEATSALPNSVYQLKVTNDTSNLYALVTGTGLNVKSQFFIDADDHYETGYHASGFLNVSTESTGAEYMVENDILYEYTGPSTGTGRNAWSWSSLGGIDIVKTDSAIEIGVPLVSLGITEGQDVGVAFIRNDSAYDRLPSADDYFAVEYVDLDPPSAPTGLTVGTVTPGSVPLSWNASFDESGVVGYDVYRDGAMIGSSSATAYTDTAVQQGSTYSYAVQAFDAAGNRSASSAPATAELPSGPSVPESQGDWNDIRDYLVNYTEEANIDIQQFAAYDAVILEPQRVSSQLLAELKTANPDLFAIGYLSIGETLPLLTDENGNRLDIYFLDASGNPIQNPDWHGYYVDARKPVFQNLVLSEWLPALYAEGFDGVFLDTVDTSAYVNAALNIDFRPSASGMASLIGQIKSSYPDKKVIMNRGYHLLGGSNDVSGSIDGVMLESYTSTWASSTLKNPDGSSVEDYHAYPADSSERIWSNGITSKINKLRFQYNADGTVQRDSAGKPVPTANYFHAMALDYAKDTTAAQKAIMQSAVDHAWENAFIPSIGVKNLDLAPAYDWLDEVAIPPESAFGSGLDIQSMPTPSPYVIDDFATADNWQTIRGQTEALPLPGADSAAFGIDSGAGKIDLTVQGTKAWVNGVTLQSREWLQPVDLTQGYVTFQAKISSGLAGTDKAFEVLFTDYNNDALAFSLTSGLTTSWSTFSLDLANGGVYYPGWDGAQDGFQPNQVKSVQIRIMNTTDNSPSYMGTLWLDDLLANQSLPAPAPLIDDFSSGTSLWFCQAGVTGDSCSVGPDTGTLRLDMNLLGTTAWGNSVTLQSRDWFVPISLTDRTIGFNARVSSSPANASKSFQFILVDRNGSTRGWDITGSLGTTAAAVSIDPTSGGFDNLAAGQTAFDLGHVRSIRYLAINTASSSAAYAGSLWLDNVTAPLK